MTATFYLGQYTRRAGERQKGVGPKTADDLVERVRIEGLPDGSVIDRPVREADKLHFAREYELFKNPPKVEPAPAPEPVLEVAPAEPAEGEEKQTKGFFAPRKKK